MELLCVPVSDHEQVLELDGPVLFDHDAGGAANLRDPSCELVGIGDRS